MTDDFVPISVVTTHNSYAKCNSLTEPETKRSVDFNKDIEERDIRLAKLFEDRKRLERILDKLKFEHMTDKLFKI